LCFVWRPQLALCLAYHLFISATGRVHRRPTGRRACRVLSVSVLIFFSSMGISSCLVGHRRLGPVNSDGHQRRADRRSFWKEYLPLMYGDHGDTDNGGLFSNSIDCGFVACFPVAPIYSAIITDNHHSRPRSVFLPEARASNHSKHDNSMQEFRP
jgi:hypothetical protein